MSALESEDQMGDSEEDIVMPFCDTETRIKIQNQIRRMKVENSAIQSQENKIKIQDQIRQMKTEVGTEQIPEGVIQIEDDDSENQEKEIQLEYNTVLIPGSAIQIEHDDSQIQGQIRRIQRDVSAVQIPDSATQVEENEIQIQDQIRQMKMEVGTEQNPEGVIQIEDDEPQNQENKMQMENYRVLIPGSAVHIEDDEESEIQIDDQIRQMKMEVATELIPADVMQSEDYSQNQENEIQMKSQTKEKKIEGSAIQISDSAIQIEDDEPRNQENEIQEQLSQTKMKNRVAQITESPIEIEDDDSQKQENEIQIRQIKRMQTEVSAVHIPESAIQIEDDSQNQENEIQIQDKISQSQLKDCDIQISESAIQIKDKLDKEDKTHVHEDLPVTGTEGSEKSTTKHINQKKVPEVEKFKRRLIRAVSRRLSDASDENSMNEMWESFQNQTRCDLKILWYRMRALTLKKLKRLLPANDHLPDITNIARFSPTDWLLYDLVLVHEDIDVIGQGSKNDQEPEALFELFFLIQEHKIEERSGDALADAWLKLTKEYNEGDRKCSPMLLQRRWYQLKEQTRARFYNFWKTYRGSSSMLSKACELYKPTILHMDVARTYRNIITKPFLSWIEMIKAKKVILLERFEARMQARGATHLSKFEPDLQVIETPIVTISLENDSDDDLLMQDEQTTLELSITDKQTESPQIKEEAIPIDDDTDELTETSNHQMISDTVNVLKNNIQTNNEENNEYTFLSTEATTVNNNRPKNDSNVDSTVVISIDIENTSALPSPITNIDISDDDFDQTLPIITSVESTATIQNIVESEVEKCFSKKIAPVEYINEKIKKIMKEKKSLCTPAEENDIDDTINKILEEKVSKLSCKTSTICEEDLIDNILADKVPESNISHNSKKVTLDDINCMLSEKESEVGIKDGNDPTWPYVKKLISNDNETLCNDSSVNEFEKIPSDIQFADDGIILEDDGIEYIEQNEKCNVNEDISIKNEISDCENGDLPKFDLKLLLTPTVYTKKLDQMDVFKFIEFNHVRDKRVLECAQIESKPVDIVSVKYEDISPTDNDRNPISDATDTSTDEDVAQSNSSKRTVDISSWLFKKPRTRNYNPIQLCKNPDFNTRLKRLSVGFLSHEQNREYLKECKSMTIDLHKAFEPMLVNNTLYLEGTEKIDNIKLSLQTPSPPEVQHDIQEIVDLEEPICSDLIESKVLITSVTSQQKSPTNISSEVTGRNKAIYLPDITEIRRVNQNLLTAEVSPILGSKVPITIISSTNKEELEKKTFTLSKQPAVTDIDKPGTLLVDLLKLPAKCPNVKYSHNPQKTPETSKKRITKEKKDKTKPPKQSFVPWLNKVQYSTILEENLLANDTVDRILAIFTGQFVEKNKRNDEAKPITVDVEPHNSKSKAKTPKSRKQIQNAVVKPPRLNAAKPKPQKRKVEKTSVNTKTCKKAYVKPIEADTIIQTVSNTETLVDENVTAVTNITKGSCCWANAKMHNENLVAIHFCPMPVCLCCCRDKLIKSLLDSITQNTTQSVEPETIELSDDEESSSNGFEICNQNNDVVGCVPEIKSQDTKCSAPSVVDSIKTNIKEKEVTDIVTSNQDTAPIKSKIFKRRRPCKTKINHTSNSPHLNKDKTVTATRSIANKVKLKQSTVLPERSHNRIPRQPPDPKSPKNSNTGIYLGKNKILLTNIRFQKEEEKVKQSASMPQITLPDGVHFVLLPNNALALSIDPGVELDKEQLIKAYSIISVVQNTLKSISSTDGTFKHLLPPTEGDTRMSNVLEEACSPQKSNLDNHSDIKTKDDGVNKKTDTVLENVQSPLNEATSISDINNSPKEHTTVENTSNNVEDSSLKSIDSDNIPTDGGNKIEAVSNTKRKTILSDLMEMSGISEDDAKLPNTNEAALDNIPMEPVVGPTIIITPLGQHEPGPEGDDKTPLTPVPSALASLASRPDLYTITTFEELKYASQYNGIFYKMDVTTGQIARINICIQKKPNSLLKRASAVSEFIDLTEDGEQLTIENVNIPDDRAKQRHERVKPIKLFRSIHPSILRHNSKGILLNSNLDCKVKKINSERVFRLVYRQKEKQSQSKDVRNILSDFEDEINDGKEQSHKRLSSCSFDESDDETLAEVKRRKLNVSHQDNEDLKHCREGAYTPKLVEIPRDMLMEPERPLSPDFERLSYDEEDDCILGV